MNKINWSLIVVLIALMIFWIFAIWGIGTIIILNEKVEICERDTTAYKIVTYYCPSPDKEHICRQIVELSTEYDVDPQLMIDLSWCESRLDPNAVGKIDNDDLGLYQINSRYHDVSDRCRKDVECSTLWTINKVKEGKISLWNCYELIR